MLTAKRFAGQRKEFIYNAPPIISQFMRSQAFGRLITGPVGSGKTTACIIELSRRMMQQSPAALDGYRYTRFAVIRQTLKQMKDTVLKDVLTRYGSLADWRVSDSTLYFWEGDVRSEWMFIPLDEPEDKKRLLSTNLTGAFVNECVEVSLDLLSDIAGRCGRYPNEEFGVPTWKGIICDTNPPILGSSWAKFMLDPGPSWSIFFQPGGREPDAENLAHLEQTEETLLLSEYDPIRINQGRKYYQRLVDTGTPDYIRRFVDGQFGRDITGAAVYGETFDYVFHCRPTLDPVEERMLLIGIDLYSRTPGTVITQLTSQGVLLVLEEIHRTDIGLQMFVETELKPLLSIDRYIGRRFMIVGDPAGKTKNNIFELNEFKLLANMGMPAIPAPTNDIDRRLQAVERMLLGQRRGSAALLIDESRCPVLMEGMNGNYRYAKNRLNEAMGTPEKNNWSHVQDALQYVCLIASSADAYNFAYSRSNIQRRSRRSRPTAAGWT